MPDPYQFPPHGGRDDPLAEMQMVFDKPARRVCETRTIAPAPLMESVGCIARYLVYVLPCCPMVALHLAA